MNDTWLYAPIYVFHRRGQPINKTTFGKQWRKACRDAGMPGKLFHDLRRSAARNMVRGGVPESVAMRVGGWKTSAVFKRYDISDNADKLDALKKASGLCREGGRALERGQHRKAGG